MLSGLGIIFSLVILIFNLASAKTRLLKSYLLQHPLFKLFLFRVVKLSSPYLNVMIIMGAILFYIDVILFGVDEGIGSPFTTTSLCMVLHTIACCCICNLIMFKMYSKIMSTSSILFICCQTRIWIASLAFTLVFGTVFVKTWRVYYIFNNARKQKKAHKKVLCVSIVKYYMRVTNITQNIDLMWNIFQFSIKHFTILLSKPAK